MHVTPGESLRFKKKLSGDKAWYAPLDTNLGCKILQYFFLFVYNIFIIRTSMGDSWILLLTRELNLLVRHTIITVWGGKWAAEVACSLGRHLLMRHLLSHDFLPSETAFSRLRPWLRSAPAARPWLDPFHIFSVTPIMVRVKYSFH